MMIQKTSPQRHRVTEKVEEAKAYRSASLHAVGGSANTLSPLFFFCVLCASVVQPGFQDDGNWA